MKIYKFGGASVKDAEGVRNLTKIVSKEKNNGLIIVISAMGKMTNALESIENLYVKGMPGLEEKFVEIKEFHESIMRELFNSDAEVFEKIAQVFQEIKNLTDKKPSMNRDFEYDKIVHFGEVLSSIIVFHYLKENGVTLQWVDAREVIRTDSTYREARIEWDTTASIAQEVFTDRQAIYITQGFIGSTLSNIPTTLGREGSDYSAAILAYVLKAESTTIWKDVPGILNADPRWCPDTIKISEISYREAIELAYYGAQVIHPKTMKPLQNKNIPLYVRPFSNPEEAGTIIHEVKDEISFPPIYIRKDNQVLISIQPKDFSFIAEDNLSEIFARLAKYRIKVNLMQNSAISFSIVADNDESRIFYFIGEMRNDFRVLYNQHLELYTIRHYNEEAINKIITGKEILLQQKSRRTARFLLR
ncbi:MAG: aspartate kinase [Bacteroidetes bacterium HGW-Bacteroidetes-21]|jgi:aspartate kinase|nr:MAG: aspartate kinase [Bacteroidetes bacterium HGW-Bacteroidetes-21]